MYLLGWHFSDIFFVLLLAHNRNLVQCYMKKGRGAKTIIELSMQLEEATRPRH